MSKFPEALPLDRKIIKNRLIRRKEVLLTAKRGVYLRGILILLEGVGFALWGSSALLLDALSSTVDILASLVLIWFIRMADRPPDQNHPYGHGRFEPVAGLLIGFLLVFLGLFTGFEQIKVMVTGDLVHRSIDPLAWMIPLAGVLILEICHQILRKTAKRQNSPALMADAAHYRIDALTSLFALFALALGAILPSHAFIFDHLGALSIALFMIVVGVVAATKNVHQLLDHAPAKKYFDLVRDAAMEVEGVLATEKLRLQVYGPDAQVAIDVEVAPQLSVEEAHSITQRVRRCIQNAWPAVRDVIVHVEPYYPGDHEL